MCLDPMVPTLPTNQKANFDICARKLRKIRCAIFHKNPVLLNFVNLSIIPCRKHVTSAALKKHKIRNVWNGGALAPQSFNYKTLEHCNLIIPY